MSRAATRAGIVTGVVLLAFLGVAATRTQSFPVALLRCVLYMALMTRLLGRWPRRKPELAGWQRDAGGLTALGPRLTRVVARHSADCPEYRWRSYQGPAGRLVECAACHRVIVVDFATEATHAHPPDHDRPRRCPRPRPHSQQL